MRGWALVWRRLLLSFLICVECLRNRVFIEALTFQDCWLLFGGVDDIGYSHANNLARLDINRFLRSKYPGHTFETKAYPGTFFMSEEDRESLILKTLQSCDFVMATSDGLLNSRHLEYAENYPNISFVLTTGSPIPNLDAVTAALPNFRNFFGSWFKVSFVAGAVAASTSNTCGGFINAFDNVQSTWSHAMGFTLGYHWVKPEQPVHLVTMQGYFNPDAEVQAARQLIELHGCDVFGRHTDPNDVDQYINGLGGRALSIARYVDMSTFVGDTVFTSQVVQFFDILLPAFEASFLAKRDGQAGSFGNLTEIVDRMELSPFTSSVDQNTTNAIEDAAFEYLETNNPLCNASIYRSGVPLPIAQGETCPVADLIPQPAGYLDLPNVQYHDAFQDGGAVCGAGQFFSYNLDLTVRCEPCPENTFYPGNARAPSGTCEPCTDGSTASVGSAQCVTIKTNRTVPITVGVTAAVLIMAVVFGAWWWIRRQKLLQGGRDNTLAPKSPDQTPIAIMFTDIQASTTIWANAPEAMAQAVEDHHDMIRAVVKRHSGYEVKTIGDAFMVVHSDAEEAVRIALEIQRELHRHDWGTTKIDEVYSLMRREKNREVPYAGPKLDGGNQCNTSSLASRNARCWNGLRIRIGIAYGTCSGQKDPVTGGWDYYGNIVNTAARVEATAHGGQILVTRPVREALLGLGGKKRSLEFEDNLAEGARQRLGISTMHSHGRIQLRGLASPIELYEVIPDTPALLERCFPPIKGSVAEAENKLRRPRDLEGASESYSTAEESESDDERLVGEELLVLSHDERMEGLIRIAIRAVHIRRYDSSLTQTVGDFYDGLRALLSLYKAAEKEKLLNEMLKRWHLRVPNISPRLLDKVGRDTPRLLMLSVRAATVSLAQKKTVVFHSIKG